MWLVGNHNLKFGTEYRRYVENSSRFPTAVSPTINFGNTWTRGPLDNSAAAPRGQDFASFLLGLPTGGSMSRAAEYTERSGVIGFYAHNDWRVRNNLTLNLGLRWEIEEPLTEADDRMISGFDFDTALPIADAVRANYARNPIPEVPVSDLPGARRRALSGHRRAARRVEAASTRTSCRARASRGSRSRRPRCAAATGCSTTCSGPNRISANQTGYSRSTALTPSLDNGQTFVATLANPFPNGLLEPVGSGLGLMTNVGLECQLPVCRRGADAAHAPLVDRRAARAAGGLPGRRHLRRLVLREHPGLRELNSVPGKYFSTSPVRDDATNNFLTQQVANPFAGLLPGTTLNGANVARSQLLRPYPQFTAVNNQGVDRAGDHRQIGLHLVPGTDRAAHGERLHGAGRLHVVEDDDRDRLPEQFRHGARARDRPVRSHPRLRHQRHRRTAVRPRPPLGQQWNGVAEALLGGWQVSFLFKAQSGAPLGFGNFLFATERRWTTSCCRADATRTWFNVDAFNRVTAQQLVSNVRTQPTRFAEVRGPGYAVLDLGFLKNVELQRAHEAAVARRGLQRAQPREPRRSEHDDDQHRVRDDHGAERAAAPVPAGGASELLTVEQVKLANR